MRRRFFKNRKLKDCKTMKLIRIKLLLIFCSLVVYMNSKAQTYVTIDGLKYQLNGTEAYVAGYVGTPTDVVIPATIESDGLTFKVTRVNSKAFYLCTSITSVRAEGENLLSIGASGNSYGAFQECTSLTSISFPYVRTIYQYAFCGCSNLEKIDFGDYLYEIDLAAFYNCVKLPYVVIPQSCVKYGSRDFNVSNNDMFSGCNRLQAIIYLGTQTSKCGSNANVYNVNNMVQWSQNTFSYTGVAPTPTFTNNLPAGFQPTSNSALPTLEKNAGNYTTNMPITFANSDMSFTVNVPYNYTINPVTLTARVEDATKVYGDANPQFQSQYSGFISGEDESVVTNTGTYSTSATASSAVGTYSVTQSGATAQNYTFQYESGTLTVTKAPLTITARNKSMNYGGTMPTLEMDYTGLKNNESKPTWITAPTITTTATATSDAGTYPITINGGEAKNYALTQKPGTLTIKKVTLTATTKNTTREYGEENPEFEMTYSGLKNNETAPEWTVEPTFATPATKSSPVGTYYINASGGEAKNYYVEYVNNGTLTVTKAPLTATARSMSKKQGEANPTFIIDYDGFKNGESALALTQEPIATTTATLYSRPGTYPITVSGGVAMNYDFSYVNGTLTINPLEDPGNPTDNMLTLSSVSGNKGKQVVLPIGLTNEKQITGLQFDLYLPTGITVATNSKGKMIIETTDRMDGNYTITGNAIDNFVRIVGYSPDGDVFTGTIGDILNVTLNISDNMDDGDYTIRIKDIVLSDVNNIEHHPADVGAMLTVKSYVLGDVDNSGAININDVVCIINYILSKPNGTFIPEAADVDGSGTININDVVTLINRYILMKDNAKSMMHAPRKASIMDDNYLHLADIDIKPGETKTVELLMTNTDEVKGTQGNIKLPAGLSFVKKSNGKVDAKNIDDRSEDFTLTCQIQDDGSLTFAQYSGDGFTYDGNDGGIFSFKIKADENATAGTYNIDLTKVVLSIDGVGYDIPDRTSSLSVTGTAGIGNLKAQLPFDVYTLAGMKIRTQVTTTDDLPNGVYIVNGKKVVINTKK